MEKRDDHQFIVRTNEQYAAWCKTYYRPEALNERGMVSLHGLWAWQEQERRLQNSLSCVIVSAAETKPSLTPDG